TFRKYAAKPEVRRHEAQRNHRHEWYEEPACELQWRRWPVIDVRREHDSLDRAESDERQPGWKLLLPLAEPDAQRRRNLLRMLEREIDRLGEALRVAVAPNRLLVQAALDRRGEARRHAGRDAGDGGRGRRYLLSHHVGARLSVEGEPAGERVVADD